MNLYSDPLQTEDLAVNALDPESESASSSPEATSTATAIVVDKPKIWKRALHAIRRHPLIFLCVALIASAGTSLLVLKRSHPSFRAEAELRISPVAPRVLYTNEEWHKESVTTFYNEYVETLTKQIESTQVLEAAVVRLNQEQANWKPEGVVPAEEVNHLRARLEVKRIRGTYLVMIAFDDQNPEVTAAVVNATARAFVETRSQDRLAKSEHLLTSLETEKNSLSSTLSRTYAELDLLAPQLGSAILNERQNIFYERVQLLEQGLTKIFLQRVEAESALGSAQNRALQLLSTIPDGDVREQVELDARVLDSRVMIARQRRVLDEKLLGLGLEHPHRPIFEARRSDLLLEIQKLESRVAADIRIRLASQRDEEADLLLGNAERRLAALRKNEASMVSELCAAKKDLVNYGRAMFEGTRLRGESTRILNEIQRIGTRIDAVRIEASAPSRVMLHQRGQVPGKAAKDSRKPMFAGGIILSLLIAAAACLAQEQLLLRRWQRSMA